jgi:recombinase
MDWHRQEAERLGAELVEVPYMDRAKSGFYGDHLEAELGKVLADIQGGVIQPGDYLYSESHSRLGRLKPMDAIDIYRSILKAGIILDISGTLRTWEAVNGPDGLGMLMQDFLDMFLAYKHSVELSKTLTRTNRLKRDQVRRGDKEHGMKKGGPGWFVGHRCPAWLYPLDRPSPEGFMYALKDSVASLVRLTFGWADSGLGTEVIARRLNERGIAPLGQHYRKKKPLKNGWSNGTVRRLLRSRAIIGEYQPHVRPNRKIAKEGDPVPNYYPPLFPDDPGLFHRVQTALTMRNGAGGKGRNGKQFTNLIKGLARCGCCAGTVTLKTCPPLRRNRRGEMVKRIGTTSYLRCENARRRLIISDGALTGYCCENRTGFPYPALEAALFSLFSPTMIPVLADMIPQKHRDDLTARRLSDCEAKIAEGEAGMKRLARLVLKAKNDEIADMYDAEIKLLQMELCRVRGECDRLRQRIASHDENRDEQIAAVIATLNSSMHSEARYDARARLHHLLANYISVTLHDDRTIKVRIKEHNGLNALDAHIAVDGLMSVDVLDHNETVLMHYDRAGLVLLEPITQKAAIFMAA